MGWDIGGAHLKAALLDSGGVAQSVVQVACPLWRGLNELDHAIGQIQAISKVQARMGELPDVHAITMTGELVDLFKNRSAGVVAIAQHLKKTLAGEIYFYAGLEGFVRFEQISSVTNEIASANWLASADFIAQKMPNALFVDVGSTTSDLVLITNGKVCAGGNSDAGRMRLDELVYSGVIRTPLMALGQKVQFGGGLTSLAAEHFATTADVYRLTADLLAEDDMAETADSVGKSQLESARRLARMIGHDVEDADLKEWINLAQAFKDMQLNRLQEAVERVSGENASVPLVGAGAGKFLAAQLANKMKRPYIDAMDLIHANSDHEKYWGGVCLPAYAVATLALQRAC